MKISRYTFPFDVDGKEFYLYNTLSNAVLEVDKDSYALFKSSGMIDIPEGTFEHDLNNMLIANGFITESDDDDYLKYKASITSMRIEVHPKS